MQPRVEKIRATENVTTVILVIKRTFSKTKKREKDDLITQWLQVKPITLKIAVSERAT